MDTIAASERQPTKKKYAPRTRSQVFRLRFDPGAIERIDKTRDIVRDKLGLNLSRAAVLTLGLTTLLTNIAELQGLDVQNMVAKAIQDLR